MQFSQLTRWLSFKRPGPTAAPDQPKAEDRHRVTEADLQAFLLTLSDRDREKLMTALDRAAARRESLFPTEIERSLRQVLEPLRGAEQPREPTLWRAVVLAAEHMIADSWSVEKPEWAIPRPLVGGLEAWAAAYPFWLNLDRAFAETGEELDTRYLVMAAAMSLIGSTLLEDAENPALHAHAHRFILLPAHQLTRTVRLFARLLLLGPAVFDVAADQFNIARADLAALPFLPPGSRRATISITAQHVQTLVAAFSALPSTVEEQPILMATQSALLFERVSDVLQFVPLAIRMNHVQFEQSKFAPLMDFVLTRWERQVAVIDGMAKLWMSRDLDDAAFAAQAAGLREKLASFEADTRAIPKLLRLPATSPWGRRFTEARRQAASTVANPLLGQANRLLEACSFNFHNPSEPPTTVPSHTRRDNERELIRLMEVASNFARGNGFQVAGQTAWTNAAEKVARQAVRMQRSWMDPQFAGRDAVVAAVGHIVCCAATLDISEALLSLATRSQGMIPNIYTALPCHRTGDPGRPCCQRLHPMFGSPAALRGTPGA